MTDAELIAKVRAASEAALAHNRTCMDTSCSAGSLAGVKRGHVNASAALALVEQWGWHRDEVRRAVDDHCRAEHVEDRRRYRERASVHQMAMDRILASLRKAVG